VKYADFENTESRKRGDSSEAVFGELIKQRFDWCRPATLQEQYKHIDWVTPRGSIDVKARKSIRRGGSIQDDRIWVEFRNQEGSLGWLYGAANFIAFETELDFVVVSRWLLSKLCEEVVDLSSQVSSPKDSLYRSYTRRGRSDVISTIKMSDVLGLRLTRVEK